ncbi:hypothetical protein Rctr197k_054 [Virus Rctr197k]|nr:hypothetical protein Rctr197k_054 [Virus Rctr197k]
MSAVAPAVHEHRFGSFVLRAHLPPGWRIRNYVKNHHYIELEDDQGKTYRVLAVDLIKGVCQSCSQEVYVSTRMGDMTCPHCTTGTVVWVWGEAKLSFVPEVGSRFTSVPPPTSPIEGEDTKP